MILTQLFSFFIHPSYYNLVGKKNQTNELVLINQNNLPVEEILIKKDDSKSINNLQHPNKFAFYYNDSNFYFYLNELSQFITPDNSHLQLAYSLILLSRAPPLFTA